jgi:hypothetical protein
MVRLPPTSRPNPPMPAAAEKWATIRYALGSWAKTIRMCVILLIMTVPADVWLIRH